MFLALLSSLPSLQPTRSLHTFPPLVTSDSSSSRTGLRGIKEKEKRGEGRGDESQYRMCFAFPSLAFGCAGRGRVHSLDGSLFHTVCVEAGGESFS